MTMTDGERVKAWQSRKIAQGLCSACGREPLLTPNYCAACREKKNLRARERYRRTHRPARLRVCSDRPRRLAAFRAKTLTEETKEEIRRSLDLIEKIAEIFGISVQQVMRIRYAPPMDERL